MAESGEAGTGAVSELATLVRTLVLADVRACIKEEVERMVHEEAHKKKQLEVELRRGFFKEDSRLTEMQLQEYLRAPVRMSLRTVPCLGEMSSRLLQLAGITNTPQLFGKFLDLRAAEDTWEEHCTKFWHFLEQHGISASHRSTIVHAVSEKVALTMPVLKGNNAAPPQAKTTGKKTHRKRVVLILPDGVDTTA